MRNFCLLFFFLFTFCQPNFLLAKNNAAPNVAIGGVINSYAAVLNVSTSIGCSPMVLFVDDAAGFIPGDFALVIQMQGAVIDESNSDNFGNVTSLNSTGLFEKVEIMSVNGNEIMISASLINDYQMTGKVQIVTIPSYTDAEVTSEIVPMPWDGNKGGIIAMDVSGTLTLQANVNATATGFRGGTRSNQSSECSAITFVTDYHYVAGSWEGEGKGEGIASYIVGKEHGRGAQANGGGGGNDHNSGGGGGAGLGGGGIGGENLDPGLFNCHGNFPGVGGKETPTAMERLFLGGGGGAGHDNNNKATDGMAGGGIIYISANTIVSNSFLIQSNGGDNVMADGLDGGGGGGGGGAVLIDVTMLGDPLPIEARGGSGSDVFHNNNNRCMGPGGGGGGGVVYTNLGAGIFMPTLLGGQPGIVVASSASCDGSSNNATAGVEGDLLDLITMPYNTGTSSGEVTYAGCSGSNYEVVVNGISYNEANPSGTEVVFNQFSCDSVITINLTFWGSNDDVISQNLCSGESFVYNGTEYNENMPTGQEVLIGGAVNGCDSIVNVALVYSPQMTASESVDANDVTINVSGGVMPFTYTWNNGLTGQTNTLTESGSYSVMVLDAFGCSTSYAFPFILTSNEEIKQTYGLDIFPIPADELLIIKRNDIQQNWNIELVNIAGQQVLEKQWNMNNEIQLNVSGLAAGVYFLHIHSDKITFAQKIVIR
jgi:hypothetical protein